jgi:hypothetical protein
MQSLYGTPACGAQDRADIVTTQVLQIVTGGLRDWLLGRPVSFTGLRAAVVTLLREEFADVQQTTSNEIRPQDE